MHPSLHRFILGMRQTQDFVWTPNELHNRLAEVLPAHAVYGLFRDAWQNEDHVFLPDEISLELARKQLPAVQKALGDVRLERVFR